MHWARLVGRGVVCCLLGVTAFASLAMADAQTAPGAPAAPTRPGVSAAAPSQPSAGPNETPAKKPTGVIRGVVVGVDTGAPLRRVQIRLVPLTTTAASRNEA